MTPETQQALNVIAYLIAATIGTLVSVWGARLTAKQTVKEQVAPQTKEMKTQLDDYDKRIIRAHDRYEELEKRFDAAQSTIKEQTAKISQLENDAKNAAITESNLRGQVDILGRQVESGQKEASLQHAREEVLKSDLKRMQGEIDKLKSELYALGQSNDALAKAKADAENRERVLIDHAKNLEARNAALMVEIDELKARIERLLKPADDTTVESKSE
jgi:chromosome segregation ATPase